MLAVEVVKEVRDRGVELATVEDRLRFRPAGSLPSELKSELKRHKFEIIELLAQGLPDCSRVECPCLDCSAKAPSYANIRNPGEVLEMAREFFGPVENPETPPIPPAPPGRDPLAKHGTDKAHFFGGDWREAWPEDFTAHRPDGAA